ncbi:Hypothetical protein SAMN02745866_02575 [Alteromonadaceae bacterium Bs31]|nr:Hypothetical protein SAMN02745866_02575 [Alteromonadaceae bacterium Bs31]
MKLAHLLFLLCLLLMVSVKALAQKTDGGQTKIDIKLNLPKLDAHPYHKPFVAVWLETKERSAIETIAIWYDDAEWLKDLRQWWRKLGRKQHASSQLDGISGATQKPGVHHIEWQGSLLEDHAYLNFEVVREEGGRSYHRELIQLKTTGSYTVKEDHEFGEIEIQVNHIANP